MSQRKRRRPSLPFLPDELIYEILVKLPVKSLMQFKRVCKSWKILISRPQFANDHIHNSISSTIITHQRLISVFDYSTGAATYSIGSLFNNSTKAATCSMGSFYETPPTLSEKLTFRMEDNRNCYCFIGSINGLICLFDDNNCFRLWNPITRLESKRSPAIPKKMILSPPDAFFGHDKVNDKYKVLAFGGGVELITVARLYTFGASYWTTIQDFPFGPATWVTRQTFVSGNLHWLPEKGSDGSRKSVIISFDVEKETYGELLLPPKLSGKTWGLDLHVSNNYLYVRQFSRKTRLVLWLMKEYRVQESWTKLMTIPIPHKNFHFCRYNVPNFRPLSILGNGVVILRTTCSHSYLVTYDSKNGQFRRYCRITESSRTWCGGIYHESLISPP